MDAAAVRNFVTVFACPLTNCGGFRVTLHRSGRATTTAGTALGGAYLNATTLSCERTNCVTKTSGISTG